MQAPISRMNLRLATEADAPAIHAIYAPIVAETAISFALSPPTVGWVARRLVDTSQHWPWLVFEVDHELKGYACAGPDRASRDRRPTAYDWSVEVSIYVKYESRELGIARALYTSLFGILRLQGFVNAFASITLPNPAAVRLHESMGFQRVGLFRDEGYKGGAWHDVGWWQLRLQDRPERPEPPKALDAVRKRPGWQAALGAGLARVSSGQASSESKESRGHS